MQVVLNKIHPSFFSQKTLEPPEADGTPIEDPVWSTPVKTKPELWPSPYTPLLSSHTNFSFSAFNSFFVRARGSGSSYSGQVTIGSAIDFQDDEWRKRNGGVFLDRVFVTVEARFTEIALREGIMVAKMGMNKRKQGLGIYGSTKYQGTRETFISYHVEIYLPAGRHRSVDGLAQDNSSFISELDISLDNMRLSLEEPTDGGNQLTTIGRLETFQLNGGMDIVNGWRANESVSLALQNGHVRDILFSSVPSLMAPKISISVVNGPIWLSKIMAKEEIILKTINGGINVTDVAMARSIKVKHDNGITGGNYRAEELEVSSKAGNIYISVDLSKVIFKGDSPWGDLRNATGDACRKRIVSVHNDAGEIKVYFTNQDEAVLLNSSIVSTTSAVVVNHNTWFEGGFEAENKLGLIELHKPRDLAQSTDMSLYEQSIEAMERRRKAFVVTTKDRGPLGNERIVGKTWWSDHDWEDSSTFCRSQSYVRSDVGSVYLDFGLRQI